MSEAGDAEALKRWAAERAAEWIRDGITLGLGTGSTVGHLLDVIAERRAGGEWGGVVGVPTSVDTERRARALGIPLATLAERPRIDLTIDGADEVDPALRLIKGLGGALLREKIVAAASAELVIVAGESEGVAGLGGRRRVGGGRGGVRAGRSGWRWPGWASRCSPPSCARSGASPSGGRRL